MGDVMRRLVTVLALMMLTAPTANAVPEGVWDPTYPYPPGNSGPALMPYPPPRPTAEHECASSDGNPDGSWCTYTNPANGLRYTVDSSRYRGRAWR